MAFRIVVFGSPYVAKLASVYNGKTSNFGFSG